MATGILTGVRAQSQPKGAKQLLPLTSCTSTEQEVVPTVLLPPLIFWWEQGGRRAKSLTKIPFCFLQSNTAKSSSPSTLLSKSLAFRKSKGSNRCVLKSASALRPVGGWEGLNYLCRSGEGKIQEGDENTSLNTVSWDTGMTYIHIQGEVPNPRTRHTLVFHT